jgi:ribokinase
MNSPIVVVGSVNLDLMIRTPQLPHPGETVLGSAVHQYPGGKGANQAVAAARLGANVSLVGAIGDDDAAALIVAALEDSGVDREYLRIVPSQATGTALIAVDDQSENFIIVSAGANVALAPTDIEAATPILRNAAVIVLSLESPYQAIEAALRATDGSATRTVLNVSPAHPHAAPLLALVDTLILNEHESATMLHLDCPDRNLATAIQPGLQALGARNAIITRGAKGALIAENLQNASPHLYEVDTPRVQAVDTTGCGDAFAGALAVGLSRGDALPDAATLAVRVASFAATRPGAQDSYPTAAELTRWAVGQEERVRRSTWPQHANSSFRAELCQRPCCSSAAVSRPP